MPLMSDALGRLLPWRSGATHDLTTKASRAHRLVALDNLGQPQWAPRDYAGFAREGFMQNAIVYRCVRMVAEAAASVPLLLYEGAYEIESHPFLDLVAHPSLDHTSADFFESWYGYLLVSGNAYVEAVGVDGQLRELHALRPDRMKVIPGSDGWPEGYEYTVGGRSIRLAGDVVEGVRNVLHVRLFHPANDYYGMSPIEAAASAIDIHNQAAKWNKALLDNSARPSGALVYAARDGQLTEEQFQRLKEELELGFQGARQAGRPMLLEGGLDWKQLSLSPKDMDFVEAKNAAAREIALALGVPPMLLGIPGDNTYAADWSEYFGYHPADGSGDVHFHLDPLWSAASIDAIGIDLYWPLSDWRDGRSHLDYAAGTRSIHTLDYLAGNVAAGEGYDWYYASDADRAGQVRTPITDGAAGKPWVFRYKDLKSWWSSPHFNRPGGVESSLATSWVPQSKPVWLMEVGCPAVDKGANQPNVFVDPKSSETALPHFSRGVRDDYMQRQYIKALVRAFDPTSQVYAGELNPVSSVYGGRMVPLERIHVYAWDARPYPAFPNSLDVWGDGENWTLGHWLNGRIANAPLDALVRQLMQDFEFGDYLAPDLSGTVPGYIVDHVMSLRDALQPLSLAYFIDAYESGGRIVLRHRAAGDVVAEIEAANVVEVGELSPLMTLTRGQETELPVSAKVSYIGTIGDYGQAVAESRRVAGSSGRVAQAELPIVLDDDQALSIVDSWLHETWVGRERLSVSLPPSLLAVEPGDLLALSAQDGMRLYRVTELSERGTRDVEARAVDPGVYEAVSALARHGRGSGPVSAGSPLVHFLDLPLLRGDEPPEAGYAVAHQYPWPGPVAIYRSPDVTGFTLQALIEAPATIGITETELSPGPEGRLDRGTRLRVVLARGILGSVTALQLLAGQNVAALRSASGVWEVLQFGRAELVAPGLYELSDLLRGQAGTEVAMETAIPAGAPFVLLDAALTPLPMTMNDIGLGYRWRYGPARRDIGDATYASANHAFSGVGLRPYAPAHVKGERDVPSGGDVTIRWVRRTRIGGDSWEVAEVPLGESREAYEVDILDGTTVRRTLATDVPEVVYGAAEQIADFGSKQSSVAVRVYQMSAVLGRGSGRGAVV